MQIQFFNINIFSLSGLILAITSLFLVIFLIIYGRTRAHKIWILFNFSVAWWGVGSFFMGMSKSADQTLLITKIAYVGVIFIPVFFYHFSCVFSAINRKFLILFAYIQAIIFSFLSMSDSGIPYISVVKKVGYSTFYYLRSSGYLYDISFFIWVLLVIFGFFETLIQYSKEQVGIKRSQFLYLFLGFFLGFLGGLTNFLPVYGVNFLPIGNFTIPFYCIISTYAILRYKLLDIKIAITRAGVFLFVYTLILGFPFWIGLKLVGYGLWLLPLSLMGFFATAGPFIYFYIQKRAEDRLLKEQRSYQATLRQASAGMGRIKDLEKLLNMIVYVLTRTVRLEHSVIYIYYELKKVYKLGAFKHRSSQVVFVPAVPQDSVIISFLEKKHSVLILDEIKRRVQDYHDSELVSIESIMHQIQAALIIPIYIDNRLTAFVGMGKKESGKSFTEDDLAVFSILSNQAALAIENAQFYEEMSITQQQLFQAEKMATIGIMADGLSHQINNRFHSLGFIAGDALDTIKLNKDLEMPEKFKEVLSELERALIRVQENVVQGGEVVQGLLKYTRKGEEGFSPIDVDVVISSAYEMAQFKIKSYQMDLVRDYDKDILPKVKGNSSQLQEVFFNLIDNGFDAMMQRKNELNEQGYHPKLIIHAQAEGHYLYMTFEDNGMGVKEEDVQKLFTPFFTTKLSSKKGTGLGLYVIRKIIEDNHKGKVEFVSKFMTGTQMKIRLPIAV